MRCTGGPGAPLSHNLALHATPSWAAGPRPEIKVAKTAAGPRVALAAAAVLAT